MANHVRELSSRLNDYLGEGPRPSALQRARNAIMARHHRAEYFDADLFVDPAWSILLHLFVAYEEETPISVANCCLAAGIPDLAANRWIDVLRDRGLVEISDDAGSDRRRIVRLTDPAHHAMRDFWQEQSRI